MSACCRIQLCCDPPAAAASLALHDGLPIGAAETILERYQLVPKKLLTVGPFSQILEQNEAQKRLAALHAHIKAELQEILPALGYPVKA